MKILSDGILSSYQVFKSRLNNPFSGAFLLSWLIINWEFLYYLLIQDATPIDKIKYINEAFYCLDTMFLYPLYSSIAYIILFPLISNLTSLIWNLIDKTLKSLSARVIEGAVPLTDQDKRQLLEFMGDKINWYNEQLKSKNLQIESLTKVINLDPEEVESTLTSDQDSIEKHFDVESASSNLEASELKKLIETKEGRFNLQKGIAAKFHKDIDNSYHFTEINKIYAVIKYALSLHPESITPRSITTENIKVNNNEMASIMSTLHISGIMTLEHQTDKKSNSILEYRLSIEYIPNLIAMANGQANDPI